MKISIITATYNSGRTLSDTIESVLHQTYQDIEYIIVDGASTDSTKEIIGRYQERLGDKLKYVSEKDNGLYDAMNKGINMATGDVIGILNSDDYYTANDILAHVAEALSDPKVDAIYGDVHYVHEDNLEHCVRYYSSKLFRRSMMKLGFMPAHPSFYCRQDIYKKCGQFNTNYRVAADFEQLLRIIYIHKTRTKYLPIDFVTMRTGGVSNTNINSRWTIMKDHRRALKSHGVCSNIFLLNIRYIYKILEVLATPFLYRRSLKRK